MNQHIDKQRGCFLGLAIGDALGAAVEFKSPGSFAPVTGYRAGGPHGLNPGEWTDDTSMALALADSMAQTGWDLNDQAQRYVYWWQDGKYSVNGRCFDIGNTVCSALGKFVRTQDAATSASTSERASGNGSIMRLAPVPIRFLHHFPEQLEQLSTLAAESSLPTHASPQCLSACRYMALVLAGLMHGVPRTEALSPNWEPLQRLRQSEPLHAEVEAVAAGSFRKQSPPAIKGNGYVVKSLEAALWAFHDAEDFRDAVLKAVNLGDDADTTGAVCGQFAGAYWGESGIPTEWLKGLARRDMIEQPLAQLLGDRRQVNVDRATKPAFSVPTLPPPTVRSYWVVENRFLAGAYPGSPDRSQHRQRVEQLWHAGKSDHNVVLHVDRSASTTKGHLAVYGPKRGKQPGALLARPVGWENWELEEDRFKRAEEHRLLYVAATRAGSQMTIVQREAGGSKNHWQFFAQHMDECDDIEDPGLQVAPGGTTVHVDQVAVNEELDKIPGRWQTAQQATYATAAAKEVSVTPSSLHHFGGSGEHDTEWGTVIHFLLEAVMRKPDANLDSLAKMAVAEQELAPDAAPAALQVIKQVTESAVWLRALNSLQRLVEVPFVTQLAADQSAAGLPTVLRGVIDLAFEEEDGWVIVDYKTDLVTGDRLQSLTDHYRGQVNTYASVWQSMLGASVKEKGLYFTSSGQYVTL